MTAAAIPITKQAPPMPIANDASRRCLRRKRGRQQSQQQGCGNQADGPVCDADQAREDCEGGKQARYDIGRALSALGLGAHRRTAARRALAGEPWGPRLGRRGRGLHGGLGSRSNGSAGN